MLRIAPRSTSRNLPWRHFQRQPFLRRQLSSTPPSQRPRTWKSSAARWGLAVAGIWYYNTHDIWNESGLSDIHILETQESLADGELPTIESLAASRRQRLAAVPATDAGLPSTHHSPGSDASLHTSPSSSYSETQSNTTKAASSSSSSPAELEEEAEGEGAFNPETGEINWDCPCLGGMAHGTCGAEFRDAFSCFVYSEKEPKGIDCIEKFQAMQDCFRAHPDEYGNELTGDDDEELEGEMGAMDDGAKPAPVPASAPYSGSETPADRSPGANLTSTPSATPSRLGGSTGIEATARSKDDEMQQTRQRARNASAQVSETYGSASESGNLVPKAWHDTREKNDGK